MPYATRPTGRYYFTQPCPHCAGQGVVPAPPGGDGWYVEYNYQDSHETRGPLPFAEALKRAVSTADRSSTQSLIGPDGQLYTTHEVEDAP